MSSILKHRPPVRHSTPSMLNYDTPVRRRRVTTSCITAPGSLLGLQDSLEFASPEKRMAELWSNAPDKYPGVKTVAMGVKKRRQLSFLTFAEKMSTKPIVEHDVTTTSEPSDREKPLNIHHCAIRPRKAISEHFDITTCDHPERNRDDFRVVGRRELSRRLEKNNQDLTRSSSCDNCLTSQTQFNTPVTSRKISITAPGSLLDLSESRDLPSPREKIDELLGDSPVNYPGVSVVTKNKKKSTKSRII